MKKFETLTGEKVFDLTQDEKARLRSVFGQIHLSSPKAEEIAQNIKERQMKVGASRGADRQ